VARQEDGAVGHQLLQDPGGQELGQSPTRPAALREDAAVAGGIAGDERPQGAQEIGDGVPTDRQESGDQQEAEAQGGGLGEGLAEVVAQRPGWTRQLCVGMLELPPDGAGLAGLLSSSLPSLGLGPARTPSLDYTGHSGLLGRNTGSCWSP